LRFFMKTGLPGALRRMSTDFPTAAVGSSQAPTATVEKSLTALNTKIQTSPKFLRRYPVSPSMAFSRLANSPDSRGPSISQLYEMQTTRSMSAGRRAFRVSQVHLDPSDFMEIGLARIRWPSQHGRSSDHPFSESWGKGSADRYRTGDR
jgi:hypothetical protein